MTDRKLFIGNLCNVTNHELRTYCEKYGAINELSMNRDKINNIYHCFAFLSFQSSRSAIHFMSDRPHIINDAEIFVKRALPRSTASIPERLVVTNRLVVSNPADYDKQTLLEYFSILGHVKKFYFDKGYIDFDDYDDVDRILLARPHYMDDKEIFVTKFIPSENQLSESMDERSDPTNLLSEETSFEEKYKFLEKQFEDYKQVKEKELNNLIKELEKVKEELSDVTQIKLDKLLKNQQLFHHELLLCVKPNSDLLHAQLCGDFLRSMPNKKRKSTTSFTDTQ